jgi:murein DD-endopeptidase MepM/ murein hydrolase activator NlpD
MNKVKFLELKDKTIVMSRRVAKKVSTVFITNVKPLALRALSLSETYARKAVLRIKTADYKGMYIKTTRTLGRAVRAFVVFSVKAGKATFVFSKRVIAATPSKFNETKAFVLAAPANIKTASKAFAKAVPVKTKVILKKVLVILKASPDAVNRFCLMIETIVIGFKHMVIAHIKGMKKVTLAWASGSALSILLLSMVATAIVNSHAIGVTIAGNEVGFVTDEESFNTLVEQVKDDLSTENLDAEIVIDDEAIALSDGSATAGGNFIDEAALKDTLIDTDAISVSAYKILVNGESIVNVATRANADTLLNNVLKNYSGENTTAATWVDTVIYSAAKVELGSLTSEAEATDLLLGSGDPEAALVKVQTTEVTTDTQSVNFETVQEKDKTLALGKTSVKQQGQYGTKEIVTETTLINGTAVDSKQLSVTVTKAPVNKIVLIGTKKTSGSSYSGSTGTYIGGNGILSKPLRSVKIISSYGGRRGHGGADMKASTGTPVFAAAGGRVTMATWYNGYGYMVEITHGNGLKTRYGHLSKMQVSKGQSVSVGQQIALSGATGRAFGAHLHFEVWVGGHTVNPVRYL